MNPEKQWRFLKTDLMPKMEMMHIQLKHLTEFANKPEKQWVTPDEIKEINKSIEDINLRLDKLDNLLSGPDKNSLLQASEIRDALIREFGIDRFPFTQEKK